MLLSRAGRRDHRLCDQRKGNFHSPDRLRQYPEPARAERGRLIDAEWEASPAESEGEKYVAEIVIYANNRSGLLADISRALTEKNIDILSMNTRINKQGMATLSASFEVGGREELSRVIEL